MKTLVFACVIQVGRPVADAEFELPADYKGMVVPVLTLPAAAKPSPSSSCR